MRLLEKAKEQNSECYELLQENLTAIDPQRFWNYNSAVGWVMCGKPIHDWKAAVRIWNTKDQEAESKAQLDFRKYGTVL